MPIDHALRKDETCLLCHDIKVASKGPAASPGPVATPQPGG
jgi:cytochrome c551/c552